MRSGAQALERCFGLLNRVSQAPATARQLVEDVGLARTTVLRMLTALERERLVVIGSDQRYRLGPRVPELFASWRRQQGLLHLVEPQLRALVATHDETAYFSVREGVGSVCLAEVESARSVRFSVRVGRRHEGLHAGALHKAILAFSPAPFIDKVMAEPLVAFTERTVTDPEAIRARLARIREQGYSESHGERDPSVVVVAAPICDHAGWALGAIGVGVLEQRCDEALLDRLRNDVMAAAANVSEELGYTGPPSSSLLAEAPEGEAPRGPAHGAGSPESHDVR